jgi:hypothetical protein
MFATANRHFSYTSERDLGPAILRYCTWTPPQFKCLPTSFTTILRYVYKHKQRTRLTWCVTPWLVVGRKNPQMATANEFFVVHSKQWVRRIQKLGMKYYLKQVTTKRRLRIAWNNHNSNLSKRLIIHSVSWLMACFSHSCSQNSRTHSKQGSHNFLGVIIPYTELGEPSTCKQYRSCQRLWNLIVVVTFNNRKSLTLTRSWRLLNNWQRRMAQRIGSTPSSTTLWVQTGGRLNRCKSINSQTHYQLISDHNE